MATNNSSSNRIPFLELARRRVVVLDGAMGTSIHTYDLDLTRDWLGQENISEVLNLTRPEIIQEIHESYLAVGADAVETNTFGANKIVLAEAEMAERTFEINELAARIARRACDRFETPDRPRYVVGSIGPGTKLVSLGMTSWDVMLDSYTEQVRGLLAGGVDVLLIETAQDLLQIKCAICAATDAMKAAGVKLPLMVQVSMDLNAGQSMLMGSDASSVVASILPYDQVDSIGLNCATGPTELTEHVRYFCKHWPRLVSVLPNAGMPLMVDGKAHFPLNPADFAKGMKRFVEEFGVNVVGGCCGTQPAHIKALVEAIHGPALVGATLVSPSVDRANDARATQVSPLQGRAPKERSATVKPQVSSLKTAEDIEQDLSYLVVAERTNTNGSRQFKRLLQEENWDGLVSMARDEVREGSHMLDVCVDFVGRDGVRDMHEVVKRYVNSIPVPLMLDSTNPKVMEAGLKLVGGRCILNSMNLEDGEERVAEMCHLARRYGAAVVAGTIDEDKQNAMARTAERKISIARRIRDLAVGKYGLRDEDLLFDPLVLPISTGIEEDRRNALETIEGTRRISQELPRCFTVVGLSNVSFGLKPAARVVLNSAFLHELREAGLTGAIVHGSKILPQNRIPEDQWNAALDLIYDRRREGFDPLTHFVSLFPDEAGTGAAAPVSKGKYDDLTIEEKLKRHIIDGEKRNLIDHLEEARKTYAPLAIINDILLEGMKVVGELFGSGQMQLPFVLQSAETMKAAVAHLEPFMEKVEGQSKGKIVLATVKGDVHDIGKNLVDIILTNNGYTVYNLGIKQPVGEILKAAKEKKADAIGMSGLLVKSVAVMKENLEEMNALGVSVPVLLGGAALTRDYAEDDLANLYRGPLLYCKDAFDGLRVMDRVSAGHVAAIQTEQRERAAKRKRLRAESEAKYGGTIRSAAADVPKVAHDNPVPVPPFWGRRVVTDLSPHYLMPFINTEALFKGQWGLSQGKMSKDEYERFLEEKALPVFQDLQRRAREEGFLQPKVVYGYFPVQSSGNDLIVYHVEEFQSPGSCCGGACGAITPVGATLVSPSTDRAVGATAVKGDATQTDERRATQVSPLQGNAPSLTGSPIRPHGEPREWLRFSFPRQEGRRRLCISDFFRSTEGGEYDVLGVQLVTVGDRATEIANEYRAANRYQDYLYLHGFGVESAEALAEFWHKRMRQELGFGSEDDPSVRKLFQQKYRGSRYSFGYPACPNLEDRALVARLLEPEVIGVTLNENFMLVPEQSTDAIVAHHPQAKYFDV